MAVMDEFREEREAMKNGTPKEKLSYFWCYYKWHVIIVVAVIAFIASFAYEALTRKDTAMYAIFLNGFTLSEEGDEEYINSYMDAAGIDPNEYETMIDTSMYLSLDSTDENTYNFIQKISVYVAAGEIDIIATGQDLFEYYAYLDYVLDLRDVLTEEQLEAYEPYLYYVDRKVIEAKNEAADNLEAYTLTYPDPTKPEEMEEPIPVGIIMNDIATEKFSANYVFASSPSVIGFMVNGSHTENAVAFLDYVLDVE